MLKDKGLLLVVSGPSGAGKSTVIGKVMQDRDDVCFSVSATTRDPRPYEVDGLDYYFITPERFAAMEENGEFLEHAEYVGNCYGTPSAPIDKAIAEGKCVVLDIEVQGAAQVMAKRKDCVSVFLCPPSLEELERRLRGRGTDTEDRIQKRLETAVREYQFAPNYDYIIINDDAIQSSARLESIITAYRCRSEFQIQYIQEGGNAL